MSAGLPTFRLRQQPPRLQDGSRHTPLPVTRRLAAAAVAAALVLVAVIVGPSLFTLTSRQTSLRQGQDVHSSRPELRQQSSRASALALAAFGGDGDGAMVRSGAGKRLLVLGGNGYVGKQVCKVAVEKGFTVTSLSRRGENPDVDDEQLQAVRWIKGDATDFATVKQHVDESDVVVHAIGLLFDVNSGLSNFNIVVSGSNSLLGEESTYDRITRQTAFNVIKAVKDKFRLPGTPPTPLVFVSCAEAGWPDVSFGEQVENVAPEWLKRYLVAKRAVEAELQSAPGLIRPIIYRPSLIWSWEKLDVLPAIPVFNALSAIGVPFVDKTVTVKTLSRAMVAGLLNSEVSGVQRFPEMEKLETMLD
eukprot:TRINITY_DN92317_c0_g1_i1.p1 TRINITY_DN92317_c0_g1~~TRINITY_DN92317_c0_g1_i1.p1  ORF type:complete len:375 (+),score=89.71 TRINITY_DN92317_c0_g1_i1:45-1127(+)